QPIAGRDTVSEGVLADSDRAEEQLDRGGFTVPAKQLHTVAPGDTLYQLSRKYHTSLQELRQWNNLRNNNIKIGHKLRVAVPKG
ncbi:LysM peptidoglycan-binding domain-containing protein, partial [Pontibacter silvestris]